MKNNAPFSKKIQITHRVVPSNIPKIDNLLKENQKTSTHRKNISSANKNMAFLSTEELKTNEKQIIKANKYLDVICKLIEPLDEEEIEHEKMLREELTKFRTQAEDKYKKSKVNRTYVFPLITDNQMSIEMKKRENLKSFFNMTDLSIIGCTTYVISKNKLMKSQTKDFNPNNSDKLMNNLTSSNFMKKEEKKQIKLNLLETQTTDKANKKVIINTKNNFNIINHYVFEVPKPNPQPTPLSTTNLKLANLKINKAYNFPKPLHKNILKLNISKVAINSPNHPLSNLLSINTMKNLGNHSRTKTMEKINMSGNVSNPSFNQPKIKLESKINILNSSKNPTSPESKTIHSPTSFQFKTFHLNDNSSKCIRLKSPENKNNPTRKIKKINQIIQESKGKIKERIKNLINSQNSKQLNSNHKFIELYNI